MQTCKQNVDINVERWRGKETQKRAPNTNRFQESEERYRDAAAAAKYCRRPRSYLEKWRQIIDDIIHTYIVSTARNFVTVQYSSIFILFFSNNSILQLPVIPSIGAIAAVLQKMIGFRIL